MLDGLAHKIIYCHDIWLTALKLNLLAAGFVLFCFGFRLHEQLQEDDDAATQYNRYVEQTEVVGVRALRE